MSFSFLPSVSCNCVVTYGLTVTFGNAKNRDKTGCKLAHIYAKLFLRKTNKKQAKQTNKQKNEQNKHQANKPKNNEKSKTKANKICFPKGLHTLASSMSHIVDTNTQCMLRQHTYIFHFILNILAIETLYLCND